MVEITVIIIPPMFLHLFAGSRKTPFQLSDLGGYITGFLEYLRKIIIAFPKKNIPIVYLFLKSRNQ